MNKKKED